MRLTTATACNASSRVGLPPLRTLPGRLNQACNWTTRWWQGESFITDRSKQKRVRVLQLSNAHMDGSYVTQAVVRLSTYLCHTQLDH
jgi:hypothetical protein